MIEENTPLFLHDCTVKLAKNIQVGDKLLNMSGEPVIVKSTIVNLVKTSLVKTRGISYTIEKDGYVCVSPRKNTVYNLGDLIIINWWNDTGSNTKCFVDETDAKKFSSLLEDVQHVNMSLNTVEKLGEIFTDNYFSFDCDLFFDRKKYFPGLLVGLLVKFGHINKKGDICISNNISTDHLNHIKNTIDKFASIVGKKDKYVIVIDNIKHFTVFKSFITNGTDRIACNSSIIQSNRHSMLAFLHGVEAYDNKIKVYDKYNQFIIKTICAILNIKFSLKNNKIIFYPESKPSNSVSIKDGVNKLMVNISLEYKDTYLTTDMIPICSD